MSVNDLSEQVKHMSSTTSQQRKSTDSPLKCPSSASITWIMKFINGAPINRIILLKKKERWKEPLKKKM